MAISLQAFVVVSIAVSFLIMGAGMKHMGKEINIYIARLSYFVCTNTSKCDTKYKYIKQCSIHMSRAQYMLLEKKNNE